MEETEISFRQRKNMTTIPLNWISFWDLTSGKNALVQKKPNSDITWQAKY